MKISVLGTRGFPKIQGGVEKHCESIYPLFNAKYQITVYHRKPYVNSDKTYPNTEIFIAISYYLIVVHRMGVAACNNSLCSYLCGQN